MEGKVHVKDHVLYIESVSPAFDYDSCQYSYIEVLFPEDVTKQIHEISITGNVKAGYIGAESLSNLGHVKLNVDLGLVEIEGINAESLSVDAGLGAIWAGSIWTAGHSKFSVGTGSVDTQFITSSVFESSIEYGCNMNSDISADEASVKTTYGYATLLRPSHYTQGSDQTVTVQTHYGKSLASYHNIYNLNFQVGNGVGQSTVVFENDECELTETEKTNLLLGVCPSELSVSQTSTLKVNTCFGDSYLIQVEVDPEMMQHNVDIDQVDLEDMDNRE